VSVKKCEHPNIVIEEHIQKMKVLIRRDGEFEPITGPDDYWYLVVSCEDCQLNKYYYSDWVPGWICKLLREANESKT
jgi:hypothetical protein